MAGFRKAKAEQAALKVGIYGPPGSGKTFTALLMAEGLSSISKKRVAFVDTEHGTDFYCKEVPTRRVHPAAFDFDALYTKSLTEILDAVHKLKPSEYSVVIIDSVTHVWEAARLAYDGRQTRAGTIPMHAWAKIKKPYKELIAWLLNSPMHVLICGRQGQVYEDDENGEVKMTGLKMKAEGETPYEPHILLRMESVRPAKGKGDAIITAFVDKDRTGILQGQVFQNPTFETLCKPILPLLGGTQAQLPSDDEVSAKDAEALSAAEREKDAKSATLLREFTAKLDLARTADEVRVIGKEITPDVKKQMLPMHVTMLREHYHRREQAFSGSGQLQLVPDASQEASYQEAGY